MPNISHPGHESGKRRQTASPTDGMDESHKNKGRNPRRLESAGRCADSRLRRRTCAGCDVLRLSRRLVSVSPGPLSSPLPLPRRRGRERERAWSTMQRQFNFASDLRERGAYKWGLRPRTERISQTSRDGRGGRAPTFSALKLRRVPETGDCTAHCALIAPLVIRAYVLARGPPLLASSPSRRTLQFQINYEPAAARGRTSNNTTGSSRLRVRKRQLVNWHQLVDTQRHPRRQELGLFHTHGTDTAWSVRNRISIGRVSPGLTPIK